MKKLFKILLVIPALYLIAVPAWLAGVTSSRPCRGIEVSIADSSEYNFVTVNEIMNIINGSSPGRLLGKPVGDISRSEVEEKVKGLKELRVAEVYLSIDGTLYIYADQRKPIMRVAARNGNDYYIDDEGFVIRRRNLNSPRLHIVSGNVNITPEMLGGVSILDTSIRKTILSDVYHIVNHIRRDPFWSAQIDQIYINGNNEIDLIPRVGNHIIRIGPPDDFSEKLSSLQAFYRNVMPEVGWNKYSVINLKYKGQVVCKRR